jgi:hypothetical protein
VLGLEANLRGRQYEIRGWRGGPETGSLDSEFCAGSFNARSLIFDLDVFDYMTMACKARKLGRLQPERRQSQHYGEYQKGAGRSQIVCWNRAAIAGTNLNFSLQWVAHSESNSADSSCK